MFAIVRNINDTELRFDASGFALFGNHTWDYIEGFIGTKIFYGTGADFYEWFYWPEKDILQATENNGLGTKHPYFNSNDINALADLKNVSTEVGWVMAHIWSFYVNLAKADRKRCS